MNYNNCSRLIEKNSSHVSMHFRILFLFTLRSSTKKICARQMQKPAACYQIFNFMIYKKNKATAVQIILFPLLYVRPLKISHTTENILNQIPARGR
jgi:hypothetical protein